MIEFAFCCWALLALLLWVLGPWGAAAAVLFWIAVGLEMKRRES